MEKPLQNQKPQKSNKLQIRNTLCQSKYVRSTYYRAVNVLRVCAFWEFDQYVSKLNEIITPSEFFEQKNLISINNFSPEWWETVRASRWRAYCYLDRLFFLNDIIGKLACKVINAEDFNSDWTFTQDFLEYRDKLRKRWEHQIKIENNYYSFSSARQMLNLFLDHVEDSLQEQCEDFIDETNKQVDLLLGTVELDRVSTTGKLLREGLGIRKIEKDYGLMMYLRQSLYRKGYEKEASNLIRKFSTESTENLVSNNYLERLVGLIQVRDQQEL